MTLISRPIAGLLLSLFAASAAQAVEFTQLQPEKSSVSFQYKQMNVPLEGQFKRFSGQLSFDPAKPAAGRAEFEIQLASIDTGTPEANDEVAGKLWFNTKAFPVARFVSTGVKALGGNRFEVAGKLSIKGRTLDVVAPASFRQDGAAGVFEGAFTLRRADYGIGEGVWADFGTVANEIQIKFRLTAAAAVGKK
jgi:polyisoprenoid-binding protein YceI